MKVAVKTGFIMASAVPNLSTAAEKCAGKKAGVWKNTVVEKSGAKKAGEVVRFTVPRNAAAVEESIVGEKYTEEGQAEAKVKEKNTINT